MQAIIQSGGKQYRVREGETICIELLGNTNGEEKSVLFPEVLCLYDEEEKIFVGTPTVQEALVEGELLGEVAGPKVVSFKYRRRKDSRRKVGHRQKYSQVKITRISIST